MSWLRKAIAQIVLSRSDAALIKSAGGAPREVRGMVLDPRFQFTENEARKRAFDWQNATPEAARARTEAGAALFGGKLPGNVRAERVYITGRSHSIPARVYLPFQRASNASMLVYYHFGGGVVGSLACCERLCGLIARASGAPVLSVDYRLAPEFKFPIGYEDALVAYNWARENAARYGAAIGVAAVGGDSMGGNFAAAIAQEMRGKHAPTLQLLIYPLTDVNSDTASMKDFADAEPLTLEALEFFKRQYLPEGADMNAPRLSPGRTSNLAGLSRALVYTAGFDILLDQGEAYADALAAAGVQVTRHCFEDLPHGFVAFPRISPKAEAALQRIARETGAALKGAA